MDVGEEQRKAIYGIKWYKPWDYAFALSIICFLAVLPRTMIRNGYGIWFEIITLSVVVVCTLDFYDYLLPREKSNKNIRDLISEGADTEDAFLPAVFIPLLVDAFAIILDSSVGSGIPFIIIFVILTYVFLREIYNPYEKLKDIIRGIEDIVLGLFVSWESSVNKKIEDTNKMNALEELKFYCEIDNPVGAVLLTGEWGCGKTYLIEHSLKDEIKDECYILRVSLFGISSVDEINNTVKRAWLNLKTFGVSDKLGKVNSAAKALSSIAAKIPRAKNIAGIAEGVLSIDIMSLISVENEINNKKVIMVFDDLERSNLNTLEVLGAINEYCENQHFNVIVVADENKIKNENSKISYKEIKEKVVQRTIFFKPDYDEVVRGIIDEYAEKGSGYAYGNFLMEQSNNLVLLFSGRNTDAVEISETDMCPADRIKAHKDKSGNKAQIEEILNRKQHNIRSLKCAIQDFKRIYELIENKEIKNKEEYFFTFVSCILASKAGMYNKDDRYGSLFIKNVMKVMYPGFYSDRYMPDCIQNWIVYGDWNPKAVEDYFNDVTRQEERKYDPAYLLKTNKIIYLEEDTIEQGFETVLADAYSGELSLNEYVIFISNSALAREYGLSFPQEIDWDKVCTGIKNKLEKISVMYNESERHQIVKSNIERYTNDENRAYDLIKSFRNNEGLMYKKNAQYYINEMKQNPSEVFRKCQNKRLNYFDHAMALATVRGFESLKNSEKAFFPGYFQGFWEDIIRSYDYMNNQDIHKGDGFRVLVEELNKTIENYADKAIAKKDTAMFLDIVRELINDLEHGEENDVLGY